MRSVSASESRWQSCRVVSSQVRGWTWDKLFTFHSWTLDWLSSDECDRFCSQAAAEGGPGLSGEGLTRRGPGPEWVVLCGAPGALVSAQSSSSGSWFLGEPYSDYQPRSAFALPLLHPPRRGLDPRHTAEEPPWAQETCARGQLGSRTGQRGPQRQSCK